MVSVLPQVISMNRTPGITAVAPGGSFTFTITNFTGGGFGSSSTVSLNQSSQPYQKMIVLLRILKGGGDTVFTSLSLSINGHSGTLINNSIGIVSNFYIFFINSPRSTNGLNSYSVNGSGPTGQVSSTLTFDADVYFLDGGSGPYEVKSGTSISHVLGSEDFIDSKAAIFAISSSAITGITNESTAPYTGADVVTSGTTVTLSSSSTILSAVFK